MEQVSMSDEVLSVSDVKTKFPTIEDGTYEAVYDGLQVSMETTAFKPEPQKCARFNFTITRGKSKGRKLSWRGYFFLNEESGQWIVGSKSKLADAIHNVTGGKTIDKRSIGTKVFITVKNNPSKKDPEKIYSNIVAIMPMPKDDDDGDVAAPSAAATQTVKAPAPVAQAKPKTEGILDDLTELSDFTE